MGPVRTQALNTSELSAKDRKTARDAQTAAFKAALAPILSHFKSELARVGKEHDKTMDEMLAAANMSFIKDSESQEPTLWNACVAYTRAENPVVEWDRTMKDASAVYARLERKLKRKEIDDEVRDIQDIHERLKERKSTETIPNGETKTERAVAQHVTRVLNGIEVKLKALQGSFGVEYAVFITKNRLKSHILPQSLASSKADEFFSFQLKAHVNDVATNMELYSLFGKSASMVKNGKKIDSRTAFTQALREQLRELTGDADAVLSWKRTEGTNKKHGVALTGWPQTIPFRAMEQMGRNQAAELLNLFNKGQLRFEKTVGASATQHTGDSDDANE